MRPEFIVVEGRFAAPPDDAWCWISILPAHVDVGGGGQWFNGPWVQPAIVPQERDLDDGHMNGV
jgi:hypothetical protein